MREQSPAHYFGLDIGTSTVRCVIGIADGEGTGSVSIIGHGSAPNLGMRKGIVVHVDDVVEAVIAAVTEAERVADTSLNFPDYTAEERTYQMLYQVIGRVGRGHRAGNIVIQTFHPDSKLIKQALTKDYEGFYADQIEERKLFNFPPFCFILKLSCTRRSQSGAQKSATSLYDSLSSTNKRIEIIGPSPAFSEKAHGSYTWQLIIKSSKRSRLTDIIGHLPANWTYDIDPVHLL